MKTQISKHHKRDNSLLEKIHKEFVGVDTRYALASGLTSKRLFLDSAASTLMMKAAHLSALEFLEHYSNTHSTTHFSASVSTHAYAWAHERILSFFHADPQQYTCIFIGSGSTGCLNRLSRIFQLAHPAKDVVLISLMEHHSNDLPHRKYHSHYFHIPLLGTGQAMGHVDVKALETLLAENSGKVSYIAVTAASNVTGILNPIDQIAELAHAYGARMVVDGSQIAAHRALTVGGSGGCAYDLDAFVFSGHKVYAPGSPGVLLIRKDLLAGLEPVDVGGGMVERVFRTGFETTSELPAREEAGTPNILGAVTLACALEVLEQIGMETIADEEERLLNLLLTGLQSIPDVIIYGDQDLSRSPRVGTLAFNLRGMNHGLLAVILNDYFNIAVRNDCFCAHPYVRELLLEELWELDLLDSEEDILDTLNLDIVKARQGMVRASLGLYNTQMDVENFVAAVSAISAKRDFYAEEYVYQGNGVYCHKHFRPQPAHLFHPRDAVARALSTS
jgi:cysteine desulfurase / selenocysteine lyase